MKRSNNSGNAMVASAVVADEPMNPAVANAMGYNAPEEEETNEPAGDASQDVPAPTTVDLPFECEFYQTVKNAPVGTVYPLMLSDIIIDPKRNGRTEERKVTDVSVKELAAAIKAVGQLQAGAVDLTPSGKMYLSFGFGRALAVQLINSTRETQDQIPFLATVNLIAEETNEVAPVASRIANALENWTRLDLTVLDKAGIVADLMAEPYKMSQAEIARYLGIKARSTVHVYNSINQLPEFVKTAIKDGKISPTAAADLAQEKDVKKLEKAATALIADAEANDGTPVTRKKAKRAVSKQKGSEGGDETGATKRKLSEVFAMIEAEGVPATDAKYGKGTAARLKALGRYLMGGKENAFLKAMGA